MRTKTSIPLHLVSMLALLLISLVAHAPAQEQESLEQQPTELHLFILAGQSNMAGRGALDEKAKLPPERVWVWTDQNKWRSATEPLHWDKPKIVGVGPGRAFAEAYAAANPSIQVGLIPCAVGGSPIASWKPGGFHQQTQSHPYDDMLARVEQAKAFGQIKGVLWHQGESDSKPALTSAYANALKTLIGRFRNLAENQDLPVLVGQLGSFADSPWSDARRSIDAIHQQTCRSVENCEFVSAQGLVHKGDKTHFDTASSRQLGERYIQAYQRMVSHAEPNVVSVERIWDHAKHNAFTDLTRFQDRWYCVFREGAAHVSPDGSLRVLRSEDGQAWESAALIKSNLGDLRDAKITVTPKGKLMLSGAAAIAEANGKSHQSLCWFSDNGTDWSEAQLIGEKNFWLWRTTWFDQTAYGVGYRTGSQNRMTRLYHSADGRMFETLVPTLVDQGYSNESDLLFMPDGAVHCLLRRDPAGDQGMAMLGHALPPYTDWSWSKLDRRIGGPKMTMLPDGRVVAAVRLYDNQVRTSLCWIDLQQNQIEEFLALPSGGDTSYAGLVWHDGHLFVSYYSSHEAAGNDFSSAIYFAKVAIP